MRKIILFIFTIIIVVFLSRGYITKEHNMHNGISKGSHERTYTGQSDDNEDEVTTNSIGMTNNQLTCSSAILMDADTGEVLFEKNANNKMYPASTTKILTALIALDKGYLKDKVKVDDEIKKALPGSSIAGLDYGETITFEDLLKGLMIPSGNDAAYTIAKHIGNQHSKKTDVKESIKAFINIMNQYNKKLELKHSHFMNPDGYHHEKHYSCARDIALITREALKYDVFKDIVSMPYYEMEDYKQYNEEDSKMRYWENTNKLIVKQSSYYYEYALGIKTGYTKEAGYCLVAAAEYNNRTVISVVLNSTIDGRFRDSIQLLNYGLGLEDKRDYKEEKQEIIIKIKE